MTTEKTAGKSKSKVTAKATQIMDITKLTAELIQALKENKNSHVISVYEDLDAESKNIPEFMALVGVALFNEGRMTQAVVSLNAAIERTEKPQRWWLVYLGRAQNALKLWADTIKTFNRFKVDFPEDRNLWVEHCLSEALLYSARSPDDIKVEMAIEGFEKAIELDNKFPWSRIGLGLAYKYAKHIDSAAKAFIPAIGLVPVEATRELLKVSKQKNHLIQARQILAAFIQNKVENVAVYEALALTEAHLHNWVEARKLLVHIKKFYANNELPEAHEEVLAWVVLEYAIENRDWSGAAQVLQHWSENKTVSTKLSLLLESDKKNHQSIADNPMLGWLSTPPPEALYVVRKLVEGKQKSSLSIQIAGEVAFRLERWREAAGYYHELVQFADINGQLYERLAISAKNSKMYAESFAAYSMAWVLDGEQSSFDELLNLAAGLKLDDIIPDDISSVLLRHCEKSPAEPKTKALLKSIAKNISNKQLKSINAEVLSQLSIELPSILTLCDALQNYTVAIEWLDAMDKAGLFSPLPEWLALEILWINCAIVKQSANAEVSQKSKKAQNQVDPLNLQKRLKSLSVWKMAMTFDRHLFWFDRSYLQSQNIHAPLTSVTEYFGLENAFDISPSSLFNIKWYKESHGLVGNQTHPIVHFFRFSSGLTEEAVQPNVYFDANWYRDTYLRESAHKNPLLHYIENSGLVGVWPHPLFHSEYVRATQRLAESDDPLTYYLELLDFGGTKFCLNGFSPYPLFDREFYLNNNPDVKTAAEQGSVEPFAHFINFGLKEDRKAHPWHTYNQVVRHQMIHLEPFNKGSAFEHLKFTHLVGKDAEVSYFNGQKVLAKQLKYKPLISVLVPVYQVKPNFLIEMIESVRAQTYENWQLCLVDDKSKRYSKEIIEIFEHYSKLDSRINYKLRKENGHICNTTNDCISLAKGEFLALLDHDDLLTQDALYEIAVAINEKPDIDVIYSDEDKVNEWGVYSDVYYKPDWSPHTIWSRMYICHLSVYRKTLVEKVGGFRPGYEGSQDHDLILRCAIETSNIHHIPRVLYHWRAHEESTASVSDAKDYCAEAARNAVESALKQRGLEADVSLMFGGGSRVIPKPKVIGRPLVDIIIPSRNQAEILETCLNSIFAKSTYTNFKVTIINNNSDESSFFQLVDAWKEKEPKRINVINDNRAFNFSLINNNAVEQTTGKFLLFLNNDTEVISPDWIQDMIGYAQLDEVGAVGVKLCYPDDTIQHAGVVTGINGGIAGHVMKNLPRNTHGYFSSLELVTNYSVLTAACLMISRKKFNLAGGFEEFLQIAFNDVDFCLKVREEGFYNVYLPFVELYHFESKSRGYEDTPEKQKRFQGEILYMRQRWGTSLESDPYYSPWLTVADESMGYRFH